MSHPCHTFNFILYSVTCRSSASFQWCIRESNLEAVIPPHAFPKTFSPSAFFFKWQRSSYNKLVYSFLNPFPTHTRHSLTAEPQIKASASLSVPTNVVPAALLRPKVDESDREQGSLNTTLTANNRRVPFYRRKTANKSSASEVALSPSTSPSLIKSRRESSRSRPSFLSRVVHKVVPCVNPDPEVVHNDDDDDASEPRRSLAPNEMTTVRPVDHDMDPSRPGTQAALATDAHDPSASPSLTFPPVTIQIQPPPSPTDSEVIVPPPPSAHLLPEDETDGVTSGAVQPPGSTGDQVVRTHTQDSEDSDGTSYTDDDGEDRHMLDEQDEEERLIRNGGSGIPIGPVRPLTPFFIYYILTLADVYYRTAFQSHYYPQFPLNTLAENAWY
jgi:hypothetical protein